MASRTAAYGRACYQWAVKRGASKATLSPICRSRPSRHVTACFRTVSSRPSGKRATGRALSTPSCGCSF